ncbi:M15 family metallopeptidase [Sphaerisporangium corydalis]|uniref:M15 family metallopeptidase n=1 Tax=Sphaerisporangium corydalis TaxID=1441875 RepID=A0ABV9ECC5_9ACTN|nr:M15 family metallopeptidase [Sphaerisporangium corydalis]
MYEKPGVPPTFIHRRSADGRGRWTRRLLVAVMAIAVAAGLCSAAFALSARWTDPVASGWWGTTGHTVGVGDGVVPDGGRLSPRDTGLPAIANLDPKLLRAVRKAADDASRDGIGIYLTSGWRSKAYQQRLLDEAIVKYGSEREARRYVDTPERSHHVTGQAVDIGPTDADDWLARHGTAYGLCQTYANEMWHFELTITPGGTCPTPLTDATDG